MEWVVGVVVVLGGALWAWSRRENEHERRVRLWELLNGTTDYSATGTGKSEMSRLRGKATASRDSLVAPLSGSDCIGYTLSVSGDVRARTVSRLVAFDLATPDSVFSCQPHGKVELLARVEQVLDVKLGDTPGDRELAALKELGVTLGAKGIAEYTLSEARLEDGEEATVVGVVDAGGGTEKSYRVPARMRSVLARAVADSNVGTRWWDEQD